MLLLFHCYKRKITEVGLSAINSYLTDHINRKFLHQIRTIALISNFQVFLLEITTCYMVFLFLDYNIEFISSAILLLSSFVTCISLWSRKNWCCNFTFIKIPFLNEIKQKVEWSYMVIGPSFIWSMYFFFSGRLTGPCTCPCTAMWPSVR